MLDEIASEMAGIVTIATVNAMTDQELARRFDIRGVPALHLYRGGARIKDIAGAMPKAQLVQWIKSSL
ncbi:MAG: hypothetical protein KA369_16535 [Spirochaetes bacterium]|nr:hypothetical protein [Spirochaetota bacterium]